MGAGDVGGVEGGGVELVGGFELVLDGVVAGGAGLVGDEVGAGGAGLADGGVVVGVVDVDGAVLGEDAVVELGDPDIEPADVGWAGSGSAIEVGDVDDAVGGGWLPEDCPEGPPHEVQSSAATTTAADLLMMAPFSLVGSQWRLL